MTAFLENVQHAAETLRGLFPETPLQKNEFLSERYGAEIYLKREDLTPVRSYKIRGAFNFVSSMLDQVSPAQAFVCASAGNHAQGLAFVCQYFGRNAVIFMPVTTPQQKIDKTRAFGREFVEIRLIGDTFDQCYAAAQDFVANGGGVMAPPFDDMGIITGQATVAYEISQQWMHETPPDLIVVPVGGGGLASGVSTFVKDSGWATAMRFAEPEGASSLFKTLQAGERVKLDKMDTFVDGAAVALIGGMNFDILKRFAPRDVIRIPENRLCATMIEMLNIEGIVVEPAGALAIDALKDMGANELRGKRIVLVVSGGNFDFERLPDVKERALRFEGLKKYYIFRFPQRPGALRAFLDLLGPDDDVARFEYLKKSARNFGSVLIAIETKHKENFVLLNKKFDESGWAYSDVTLDPVLFDFVI
ncbi:MULTISPECIES: threonine ammonia-lyase IlvA [unclassified Bartonella]|uniref:threonine ammonia-lyase IlvA n=1 Tax=unclassified Bartonella TaxID=2645622 RepID=UPI0021C7621B|nr:MULTISPECIES: threonine ammonia-lyase IlvA [unclassified Bartonella]UXN02361.1 threonine ammonia-lyase IlvA [Bartonella sp. HY406]UXN05315.1 threonine ammonia-lyase IlvA [Bartonella sp. HY761]